MNKTLLCLILLISHFSQSQSSGAGVTDIDGNFYPSVIIGAQEWTTVNLRVTHFKNGELITNAQYLSNLQWNNLLSPARCLYEANQSSYYTLTEDGLLYNWFAVSDTRGLAPEGWHIPTKDEWETLIQSSFAYTFDVMRKINDAGSDPQLKYWKLSCASTQNPWNFSALASGGRFIDGTANTGFYGYGPGYTFPVTGQPISNARTRTYFWSSNSSSISDAWCARIITCVEPPVVNPNPNILMTESQSQRSGFSIRLVKDAPLSTGSIEKQNFKVYPNPTKGLLHIQSENDITGLTIIDITGKTVYHQSTSSETINIENLERGIYIVKVATAEGVYSQKLIKD